MTYIPNKVGPTEASASLSVAGTVRFDTSNTHTGTLAANTAWTGSWVDTAGYSQIVTSFKADQVGKFRMQFSTDSSTIDRDIGPYVLAANTDSPQPLAPIRRYYRALFENSSSNASTLRIETVLRDIPGVFQTRITDTVTNLSPANVGRVVLFGSEDNRTTYDNVGIDENRQLRVALPETAFNEMLTGYLTPVVQIAAPYGLLSTDIETFTSGSSSTATASGSLYNCTTGTGVGDYSVIRSKRLLSYKAGNGVRGRITAMFPSGPIANSLQGAGLFTNLDGLFFGYNGDGFGITRRLGGSVKIVRMTLTNGATAGETLTVKLNDINYTVTVVSGTSGSVANQIASSGSLFLPWSGSNGPTANLASVTFVQSTPAQATGVFSITSTGTTTGSFTTLSEGAANNNTAGYVSQSAWNVDRMDGSYSAYNPSGMLLDPTKLNVYEVVYPFLGAGAIQFRIMSNSGSFVTVHKIEYPNNNTAPSQQNPSFRLGWFAASLGSTTAMTIKGASAGGFLEGQERSLRNPFAIDTTFTATTTEQVVLALRVRSEFQGKNNLRELLGTLISSATETANRVVRVRCYANPTFNNLVSWQYVDQNNSSVEYTTPASTTLLSGQRILASISVPSGAPGSIDLEKLNLRVGPGQVFVITMQAASTTAVCVLSANWIEI
jgi:hypothetical protein